MQLPERARTCKDLAGRSVTLQYFSHLQLKVAFFSKHSLSSWSKSPMTAQTTCTVLCYTGFRVEVGVGGEMWERRTTEKMASESQQERTSELELAMHGEEKIILLIPLNSQKAQELENFGDQKVWANVKLKIRGLLWLTV